MSRFYAAGVTSAGSTTLPLWSMYTATTGRFWINQISLWNTTSTSVSLKLVRLSTTGTRGATIASGNTTHEDPATATATVYQTHTVAPTVVAGDIKSVILGASVGSGVIWSWNDRVLTVNAASANNGIGIIVTSGTGQPIAFDVEWGE